MSSNRLSNRHKSSVAIYILLLALGGVLVAFGFYVPADSPLSELALDEMFKIVGTLILGLGFGGIVSIASDERFSEDVLHILQTHSDGQLSALGQLFEDYLGAGGYDEPIPDRYRKPLTLYHQTGTDDRGSERFWVCRTFNFSGSQLKKKLTTETSHADPRPGFPVQKYAVEMTVKRGKIVLMETNLTDPGEVASVTVFNKPLLQSHAFGTHNHVDWTGRQRISRAILTSEQLEIDWQNQELADEALNALWEGSEQGKAIVTAVN